MPGAREMLAPLLLLKMEEILLSKLVARCCHMHSGHKVSKRHIQSTDSITQGQHPMPGARVMLAPLWLLKMGEIFLAKLVASCCHMNSGHRSARGRTRAHTVSPKVCTPGLAPV